MKKNTIAFIFIAPLIFFSAQTAHAATVTGKTTDSARLRSKAAAGNTPVLATMPKGTSLSILEEQDGWFYVQYGKKTGWVANFLIKKNAVADATVTTVEASEQNGVYTASGRLRKGAGTTFAALSTVPKGTIVKILQTKNGWYEVEYNGKKGWSANTVLTKTATGTPIAPVVAEKTVSPSVPVSPGTPSVTIPDKNLPVTSAPKEAPTPKVYGNAPAIPLDLQNIHKSSVQAGIIPDGVDIVELNKYWLNKVNTLRVEKELSQLVLDQRWVDTATEYAGTIGDIGKLTHSRPNGRTMHQWINGKGLQFTVRNSKDGWKTNYFTENLSSGVTDGTMESAQAALDAAMEYFINEGETGPHYKTIYHTDWNSTGLGFYFKPRSDGKFDLMVVYHYGSLQM